MEAYWKAVAVMILTIILGVTIGKSEKDISIVLTIVACIAVSAMEMQYFSEVIGFLWKLASCTVYQNPFLETLLRISGVALITELVGVISSDAGSSSIGKTMQILGNAVILFLSLPIFESFFTIIQEIMRV